MNLVILKGHLGKDPESRIFGQGKEVATFSLATTKHWKQDGERKTATEWHNVTAFNGLAGIVTQYCKKGSEVLVTGEIKYESYEKDGQRKYVTKIVADKIELLGKRPDNGNNDLGSHNEAAPTFNSTSDDLPF